MSRTQSPGQVRRFNESGEVMSDPFSLNPRSEPAQPRDESKDNAAAVMIVGALVLLFIGKHLPMIVLGLILGWFPYAAVKYGPTRSRKCWGYTFDLLFFAALTFTFVGRPGRLPGGDYPGLIAYIPHFGDFAWGCVRQWNELVPDLGPFAKHFLQSLRVTKLEYVDVSNYVWFAVYATAASSALYLTISIFRGNTKTESGYQGDKHDTLFQISVMPAQAFSIIPYVLFWGWLRVGDAGGWKVRGRGIATCASYLFLVSVIGLAIAILGRLAYLIPYSDLRSFAEWVVYFPVIGMWTGLAISIFVPTGVAQVFGLERSLTGEPKVDSGDGFLLGRAFNGKPYRLSEENLAYHVEMVAPTGSGKTNLLKNLIADRIAKNQGVIFLDLKADFDVVAWMYRAATASGREADFRLLSLANRELSVPYNPIKFGEAAQIHSQLMGSMTWSEEYYRNVSSVALMTLLRALCAYRDQTGESFHLGHLYSLLSTKGLIRVFSERLKQAGSSCARMCDPINELAEQLDRPSEREKLSGLMANLNILVFSAAGSLLTEDTEQGSFDLREAIGEGRLTCILVNSLKLKESAAVFGKMILQDLMALVGDRYALGGEGQASHRPITLIIDEFAAFAIPEFIEFMDRARGAGIGIILAHQARADLRKVSPDFQERIEANANTTIVSGVHLSADADHYAGMVGTRTTMKETHQTESGFFGDRSTGKKSVREVEEYVIHPNQLKGLKQGEVFTVSRTKDKRYGLVKVGLAQDFAEHALSQSTLSERLRKVRLLYIDHRTEKCLSLDGQGDPKGLTRKEPGSAISIDVGKASPEPALWN